jgi:acetolactate synthase regulatory subunit
MSWRFQIEAVEERRILSRILHVLETQLVSITSFSGEANETRVSITCVISCDRVKAYRVEALLYNLNDVRSVLIREAGE